MGVWDGAPRHDIWHILRYAWEANYWDAYHLGESWFSKKCLEQEVHLPLSSWSTPCLRVERLQSEGVTFLRNRCALQLAALLSVAFLGLGGPRSHWKKGALRGRRFNHGTCEERFLEGTRVKPFRGSPAFKVFNWPVRLRLFRYGKRLLPILEKPPTANTEATVTHAFFRSFEVDLWLVHWHYHGLGLLEQQQATWRSMRSCRCCLLAKNLGHRTSPQK